MIRRDLGGLRDDAELHRQVEEQLRRLRHGRSDAREQLGRRLAEVDQQLARVRNHVMAVDSDTARSLGLYEQAKQLNGERVRVEGDLRAARPDPELPGLPELRERISAEFDRMVGLERFRGRLGERPGTFVLTHRGTYVDGAACVELAVVDGSGTGALTGLRGTAMFASGPAAEQEIEFEFAFGPVST